MQPVNTAFLVGQVHADTSVFEAGDLHCQFVVCTFDLRFCCIFRYAKHLVQVFGSENNSRSVILRIIPLIHSSRMIYFQEELKTVRPQTLFSYKSSFDLLNHLGFQIQHKIIRDECGYCFHNIKSKIDRNPSLLWAGKPSQCTKSTFSTKMNTSGKSERGWRRVEGHFGPRLGADDGAQRIRWHGCECRIGKKPTRATSDIDGPRLKQGIYSENILPCFFRR
jgi:hypothetical protein